MTELQEAIVDRLMVAEKIGAEWKAGPLGLAVEALASRRMFSRGDVTDTLGYPMLLCKALQSATSTLEAVDDRRKLAITFFSEVPPRSKRPRLTAQHHARLALWCAESIHPLVCRADCPFAVRVGAIVSACLGGNLPQKAERPVHCLSVKPAAQSDLPYAAPEDLAVWALNYAVSAAACIAEKRWPGEYSSRAAGDAAQVAGMIRGVAGAVDFCLALAQQLGLRP